MSARVDRRWLLCLAVALCAARPSAAQQPSGIGVHLDIALSSLFDGGLVLEPGDTGTYGGGVAAALRFQTAPYRPALQLEYRAGVQAYHGTTRWDRTTHVLSGLLGTSLGPGLRLETVGWLAFAGATEDRERVDEYTVTPRLEYRITRSDRVRVRAGARRRSIVGGGTPPRTAVVGRVEYRHRFGRDRSVELEYRYAGEHSDDRYASLRSTVGVAFESRLGRHNGVAVDLRYRTRRYPNRTVRVGELDLPTRDRIWMPSVLWAYADDGAELRLTYRYEVRASNDPGRSFDAHRVGVEVRRTMAFLGAPRPFRFDSDPWEVVGSPRAPVRFRRVGVGGTRVCAVADAGDGYCWAGPPADAGRLESEDVPEPVPPFGDWLDVSVGQGGGSCGVTHRGSAYCWSHTDALLGEGLRYPRTPARVPGDLAFRGIAAGWTHACGITRTGRAYCWGDNAEGVLGDGSFRTSARPVAVAGDAVYREISAGWRHTCALADDGAAWCWGRNDRGQLGIGGLAWTAEPMPVDGPRFVAISAGTNHTCATTADGEAWCWGANDAGQLGRDDSHPAARPARVAGDLRFAAISAGWAHTCGVTTDGRAYCWGQNRYGQLGAGSRDQDRHPSPSPVRSDARFTAISASFRTCAVDRDGAVHCWGDRSAGERTAPDGPPALPAPLTPPRGSG